MTVKILSKNKIYTCIETCGSCEAELEATEADFAVGYFGANYGGDTGEPGLYFLCPICDDTVRVSDAPQSLLNRIQNKPTIKAKKS